MTQQIVIYFFMLTCFYYGFANAQYIYAQAGLDEHNNRRSTHQVDAMTLSDDLNDRAVKCAQYYADKGKIDHSCPHKGDGVGENLYTTSSADVADVDVVVSACNAWYSESKGYDYNKDYQKGKGHFSQMVWKGSSELGIGTGRGNNGQWKTMVAALYRPQGNIIGQFRDNVFPPK